MAHAACSSFAQRLVASTATKRGETSRTNATMKVQKPLAAREGAFLGTRALSAPSTTSSAVSRKTQTTKAGLGLGDIFGGDLIQPNIGDFLNDLETYSSLGCYVPPEGGYEGRFITAAKRNGYQVLNVNARGLGDVEAYLTKVHGIRPPPLGKQPIQRFYEPGMINMIQDNLPANKKRVLVWIQECKVLSKMEITYLAVLAAENPDIKIVCEVGVDRYFNWKALKDVYGLVPGKFETA
uniref:Uncharacterized protein n=1 Tax=Pyramimonas obovata TaxID=1411642 RepID=A0A7S0WKM6_9CHLO|eukprot:CAMPEP_0118931918 /NCGR_PEP_ID=MMETSP1169-20130426/8667_1 /TAXON_ID=36882 /ORGANISM="Pyramimonas obovata, Strain CCMP722" /LENGTH=237 /DNA_ID=CAMNT_0006874495 /DNA_START=73 /DNA_END=786 /DNA_ORIENTATION=+